MITNHHEIDFISTILKCDSTLPQEAKEKIIELAFEFGSKNYIEGLHEGEKILRDSLRGPAHD